MTTPKVSLWGLTSFLVWYLNVYLKSCCGYIYWLNDRDLNEPLPSILKRGKTIFWDKMYKHYLTKDQTLGAFLGFCICAPFFALLILVGCEVDEKYKDVKFSICFLCFILSVTVIPIFSIRNAVKSVEEPSYKELCNDRGSFWDIYLYHLEESFLLNVFYFTFWFFFVLLKIKMGLWEPLGNSTFVKYFVLTITWIVFTAALRVTIGTFKWKSNRVNTCMLSGVLQGVPHLFSTKYFDIYYERQEQRELVNQVILFLFCFLRSTLLLLLCFLWETKCVWLRLFMALNYKSWPVPFLTRWLDSAILHLAGKENPNQPLKDAAIDYLGQVYDKESNFVTSLVSENQFFPFLEWLSDNLIYEYNLLLAWGPVILTHY